MIRLSSLKLFATFEIFLEFEKSSLQVTVLQLREEWSGLLA
jgi:hypothetical protein